MFGTNLGEIKFPLAMSDEAKIIWARQNNFTIREIKFYFRFGSGKIDRILKHFNQTGEIPQPLKQHPAYKLTKNVLIHIHQLISSNAHITLQEMQQSLFKNLDITISLPTIATGCHMLRYHYKPPQKTMDLTEEQKKKQNYFCKLIIRASENSAN